MSPGILEATLIDVDAYGGNVLRALRRHAGFRFLVVFRLHGHLKRQRWSVLSALALVTRLALVPMRRRYDVPPSTDLGERLFLSPHAGAIVINGGAAIGSGCHLNHGVTIGETMRGSRCGAPRLGDHVYVGAGACILGDVTIGDDVVIGANCVVTTDLAPSCVVATVRPTVLSHRGADGYLIRKSAADD